MYESILIGCGFAFAAAVQPGPLQAFLFSSVSRNGWKRTLPASFSPLLSDGPIALFVLLVLNHISTTMYGILQVAGGFLLLYFAWTSYRQWKRYSGSELDDHGLMPRTLIQAATVNILNPNPYLGWSLILGPAFLAAWQKSPVIAFSLIIAFYTTMVAVLACIIFLFGTTRFLSPRGRRKLILVSALILAAMGVYQLIACIFRAGANSSLAFL
jgi:threonine/homoserine/homoserine lactone efflux protein